MKTLEYSTRKAIVRGLGFKSYTGYLRSSLWKKIRRQVLERDQGLCLICLVDPPKKAQTVHHKFYSTDNMNGSSLAGLFSCCNGCHRVVEYTNKKKLDIWSSQKKLEQILQCRKSCEEKPEMVEAFQKVAARLAQQKKESLKKSYWKPWK